MNIGRSDIDWKSLSHNEIDRIIAERIEADNKRIEANGGKKSKRAGNVTARYELHTGAGVSGEIVRIYGEQ